MQVAKKYLEHTTAANKFELFFRHEYMHLIWLSEYDPQEDTYHRSKESYLPPGVEDSTTCHCGQQRSENQTACDFCCHILHKLVERSADGKVCIELNEILQGNGSQVSAPQAVPPLVWSVLPKG